MQIKKKYKQKANIKQYVGEKIVEVLFKRKRNEYKSLFKRLVTEFGTGHDTRMKKLFYDVTKKNNGFNKN